MTARGGEALGHWTSVIPRDLFPDRLPRTRQRLKKPQRGPIERGRVLPQRRVRERPVLPLERLQILDDIPLRPPPPLPQRPRVEPRRPERVVVRPEVTDRRRVRP